MLTEEELERIVSTLAADDMNGREEGSPGGIAAREFLIEEWTACGIQPVTDDTFEHPITTGDGVNLVGMIEGADSDLRDRYVLLSAHYDHIGSCGGAICNGAYDNATAVAAVIGVACTLAETPPARSILVAHWDAEEPPTFLSDEMGSEFFAENPVVPLSQIDVAIVGELMGAELWPGYRGHFALGAETASEVTEALIAAETPEDLPVYRFGLHMAEESPLGHQPWSDYDGFRNRGVPVIMLSNGQNKHYHMVSDELENADIPKLVLEAQHLLSLTENLANATETPIFDANGADHLADAIALREVLEAALASGGLVDALGLNSTSQGSLEDDLSRVIAIHERLEDGGTASSADLVTLESGTLRVMCLAGSSYDEFMCNLF
jgi:hypothetical protein